MNPYFKAYLKNAAVGATAGAVFGAACGSGGGVVGLRQMCSGSMSNSICTNSLEPLVMDSSTNSAASAGAGVGAAIGFSLGAIVYPVYKGLVAWCYPRVQNVQGELESSKDIVTPESNGTKAKV